MKENSKVESVNVTRLVVGALACAVALGAQAADPFTMQVHPKEVPGTWEISNGNYERAVVLLEVAAARSDRTRRDFGAIVNNLCIAYTKVGKYEQAMENCNKAVEATYPPGVAFNNRGVLQALRGDLVAAAADFEAASSRRESAEAAQFNIERLDEQVSEVTKTSPATAGLDPRV